jgi:hypothetical protein
MADDSPPTEGPEATLGQDTDTPPTYPGSIHQDLRDAPGEASNRPLETPED